MARESIYISAKKLRIGMYVDLEMNWMEHSFLRSKFRINSTTEISQIRSLKPDTVKILINKSERTALQTLNEPLPEQDDDEADAVDITETEAWQRKQESLKKAELYKKEHRKVVQQYREMEKRIGNLARNLRSAPANAIRDANEVIDDVMALMGDTDSLIVSMVNLTSGEYTIRHHSLNVTVLALALGRSLSLNNEELHWLGVGALLHDVGKVALPATLLNKEEDLTLSERQLLRTHVSQGVKLVQRIEQTPQQAIDIIAHHHAYIDGSGFPPDVLGEQISKLCRMVQVCDHYENMCNPSRGQRPFSPKVAMAKLFSGYEGQLDSELIHMFVRNLGVYPPGTVVKLNDDSLAVVVSINSENLLTPKLLIYNPDIPANKALMIDLGEHPEMSIQQAMKPGEYPEEVKLYLGIEDQLGYFLSPNK